MISIELTADQLQQPGVAESLASLMRALSGDHTAKPDVSMISAAKSSPAKKPKTTKAAAKEVAKEVAKEAAPKEAAPKAAAPKAAAKPAPKAAKKAPKAAAGDESVTDLESLMAAVSESSRKFLEILQNRKQLTMKEAMVALGLEEKKAVGGVVGGVSRKAQKHGLYPPYRTGKTDAGDRLWKWTGDVHTEPKALPAKKKKRGRPKGKKSSKKKD